MYSLTFCVRFLLPERHETKPAVQAAAVMLRTPDVESTVNHRRASHAHFSYTARNFENAPRLCVCLSVCPRPYAHTTARTRM